MTPEDKIIAAIDRNTDAVERQTAWLLDVAIIIWIIILTLLIAISAKAAPLISDGDEIASVGTVQVITPHPSWAPAIGGTEWISIAQTGWPLLTWLPNGTVVSFSEIFSLASMPSSAMVTWAADDSASVWLNGSLVAAEAPTAGNGYSTCSDFAPTCTAHTSVDVLPWLTVGENEIRFDVAQRGGYSYGLNYSVGLLWLDEPPLPTPEPGTWIQIVTGMIGFGIGWFTYSPLRKWLSRPTAINRYRIALQHIAVARKALEE